MPSVILYKERKKGKKLKEKATKGGVLENGQGFYETNEECRECSKKKRKNVVTNRRKEVNVEKKKKERGF